MAKNKVEDDSLNSLLEIKILLEIYKQLPDLIGLA